MAEIIFLLILNCILFPNGYTKSQTRSARYGAYCGAKKVVRHSCRW